MPESDLRLIKRRIEFITPSEVSDLPSRLRGIYVLYKKRRKVRPNGNPCFDVVYVGMVRNGVKGRLWEHLRKKKDLWSHCSVFEVWDNISNGEIAELEGILRHLYRLDAAANKLAMQRSFAKMAHLPDIVLKKTSVIN